MDIAYRVWHFIEALIIGGFLYKLRIGDMQGYDYALLCANGLMGVGSLILEIYVMRRKDGRNDGKQ